SSYTLGSPAAATAYIADPNFPVNTTPIPAPANLVGWWRAEGNALDSAGVNNGSFLNGLACAPAYAGQGLNFDGVDDRFTVPDSTSLNFGVNKDFSIEAWIRPINATTDYGVQSIVDKRTAPDDITSTA